MGVARRGQYNAVSIRPIRPWECNLRQVHILFLLVLAATALLTISVVEADERAPSAEMASVLRGKLIEAFKKQAYIHRAWAIERRIKKPGDISHVELFRDGDLVGLSAFMESGGSENSGGELRVVTNGEYVVGKEVGAPDSWRVTPGTLWQNRRRRSWDKARELLADLYAFRVSIPGEWNLSISLQAKGEGPGLEARLDVSNTGAEPAGWLAAEQFQGKRVTADAELVYLRSKRVLTSFSLSDGLPRSIVVRDHDGKVTVEMTPTKPRRGADAWRRTIRKECAKVANRPPGSWDMSVQAAEFCRLLASGLVHGRETLKRPSHLRSVVDVMMSVLFANDEIDRWLERESLAPECDADATAKRLSKHIWRSLWDTLDGQLDKAALGDTEREELRLTIWSSLSSRIRTAAAMYAKRRKPRAADRDAK